MQTENKEQIKKKYLQYLDRIRRITLKMDNR